MTEPPRAASLAIEAGRITALLDPEARAPWPPDTFLDRDAKGLWILPGFVQGHVHLCQSLFRGWAERRSLYRWLAEVIWPGEAALDEDAAAVAAEFGIVQLLAGGVTTLLDMGTTRHEGAVAEVAARLGIRALLGPALMDRGPDAAAPLLLEAHACIENFELFASRWDGHDGGRLRAALCPRFVPSVSDPLWREIAGRGDLRRFPIHSHVAETRDEVQEVERLTGTTPACYLASLEGAEGRLKLAHGVWLTDEDRRALRKAGAAICHCPSSNMKLGSGIADLSALEEAGVPVALGPDGAACNNRLDPWLEMRLAGHLASLLHGPEAVDAEMIFRMATIGAAAALGIDHEVGSLEPGKQADLILVDPEAEPALAGGRDAILERRAPHEGPLELLLFAGSPSMVRETWVSGNKVHDAAAPSPSDLGSRVSEARTRLHARLA